MEAHIKAMIEKHFEEMCRIYKGEPKNAFYVMSGFFDALEQTGLLTKEEADKAFWDTHSYCEKMKRQEA